MNVEQGKSEPASYDLNDSSRNSAEKFEWLLWMRKLSGALLFSERYLGQVLTGLLVGLFLLLVASIYVTPALECINHGQSYAWMSVDPFKMDDSPFRHRILSPLIAYYVHLRHRDFIYFPLLLSVLFLGLIYIHFRREKHAPSIAFLASCTMAFSSPVLHLLHYQCYTDILTHLLLFVCLMLRKTKVLWVIPLALSSLNHEATIFSIPWVVFLRSRYYSCPLLSWRGSARFTIDLCLAALSLAPLFVMKELWPLENSSLSPGFYLSAIKTMWEQIFQYAWLGIFEAFKIFWFIPLVAIYLSARGERCSTLTVYALMFAAGVGQLLVANDTSRLVGHSFPLILYSLELLSRKKALGDRLAEVVMIIVILNFFVPQYQVGQRSSWPFLPVPVSFLFWLFGYNPWGLPFTPWG